MTPTKIDVPAEVLEFAALLSERLESLTAFVCETMVLPDQTEDKPSYFIQLQVRPEWRDVIDLTVEMFDQELKVLSTIEERVAQQGDFPVGFGFSTDDYEASHKIKGEWEILPWTLDTKGIPFALEAVRGLDVISSDARARALQDAIAEM